jgi:hypothetical protein
LYNHGQFSHLGRFARMDLLFIGLTALFFILSWGLIKVFEKV